MTYLIKKLFCFVLFTLIVHQSQAQFLQGYPRNPSSGCSDGQIITQVYGGIPPYTFEWSNGSRSSYLTDIPSGEYCVTVSDVTCCQDIQCFQLADEGGIIEITQSHNPTGDGLCDGSIDVTATGSGVPFTFQWSNGATTEDISNLCTGPYTVTVTSRNGCTKVLSTYLNKACYDDPANMFRVPPPLEVVSNVTSTSNSSINNGSINLYISGGLSPYYISWSGPNGFRTNNPRIQNLSVGTYCVTITDGCDGVYKRCFEINDCSKNNPIVVTVSSSGPSCNRVIRDLPGATLTATATGGVAPYSYSWSYSYSNLNPIFNVTPDSYIVTVTDNKSCKAEGDITVRDGYYEVRNNCLVTRFCAGRSYGIDVPPNEGTISYDESSCNINYTCYNGGQGLIARGTRYEQVYGGNTCIRIRGCLFNISGQLILVNPTTEYGLRRQYELVETTCSTCPTRSYACVYTVYCALTRPIQIISQTQVDPDRCGQPIKSPDEDPDESLIERLPNQINGIKIIRNNIELDSFIRSLKTIVVDIQNSTVLEDKHYVASNSNNTYQVYPNPTEGSINLDYLSETTKDIEIVIENLLGQMVFHKTFSSLVGKNSHSIDLESNCSNGIYLLRVKHENNILFTTKIIKQN